MKIAVVGSRNFEDAYARVKQCLTKQRRLYGRDIIVVTGGSGAVDNAVIGECILLGLRCYILPAQWEVYGNKAGPIRNSEVIRISDKIIVFWDKKSKGSRDVIRKAKAAGKELVVRK